MLKFGYGLVLLLIVQPAVAIQNTYTITISEDLYGEVSLKQPGEVFNAGRITIFAKKSGRQLIRVDSEELAFSLDSETPLPSGSAVPLRDQDVIIYEDFNFDGTPDLAVMSGHESCYHGPSYDVYLAERGRTDRFKLSAEFTSLATDYCGMFDVDAAAQELSTSTKSGCCWHQYTTFKVFEGKPKPIRIIEEDATQLPWFVTETESVWNGKDMVSTRDTTLQLHEEDGARVFSFQVMNKNASVVLFSFRDNVLTYAFVKEDERVELMYPDHAAKSAEDAASRSFRLAGPNQQRKLSFGNKWAQYTVYQNESTGEAGILIQTAGKSYDWKAIPGSVRGSLDLAGKGFENVHTN